MECICTAPQSGLGDFPSLPQSRIALQEERRTPRAMDDRSANFEYVTGSFEVLHPDLWEQDSETLQ